MAKGWRPIAFAEELYDAAKGYYDENKDDLSLKCGIRSLTAFIDYYVREYLKEKGII